jgi:tetratricopeptide (TPR) repeat protein
MRITISFLFLLCATLTFAQTETDQQLAQHYYMNGEFEKARTYYEKLYEKDPSKLNFNRLYECIEHANDTKEAEKLIKKQLSANRNDLEYPVLLGQFYENNNVSVPKTIQKRKAFTFILENL